MNSLSKAPNIGKVLADKLELAEIESVEALKQLGAEKVFIKLKCIDPCACINSLYAIEGAIQDIRWHGLSKERKIELKNFFDQIK